MNMELQRNILRESKIHQSVLVHEVLTRCWLGDIATTLLLNIKSSDQAGCVIVEDNPGREGTKKTGL